MKSTIILISLLLMQNTSSSFFEGIDKVMSNAESGIAKLITDVISDVKDTIDCTILAVEHVLEGINDPEGLSEYQLKCGGFGPNIDYEIDSASAGSDTSMQSTDEATREIEKVENDLTSAIKDINNTFNNIVNSDNFYSKLEHIQTILKNETDHLLTASNFFKSRLDKISGKMKETPDSKESNENFFKDIYKHLELLHEAEKSHQNTSEINEIHDVIKEILRILEFDSQKIKSVDDYDKIQAIIDKLSQQVYTKEVVAPQRESTKNTTVTNSEIQLNNKDTEIDSQANTYNTDTSDILKTNKFITTSDSKQDSKTQVQKPETSADEAITKDASDSFDVLRELNIDDIFNVKLSHEAQQIIKAQKESEFVINKYFNNPSYILKEAVTSEDESQMSAEEIEEYKENFNIDYLFDD